MAYSNIYPRSIQDIPYGYCHCGCGKRTSIPKRSHFSQGIAKGVPSFFVKGHSERDLPPHLRFWRYVTAGPFDQCWIWEGRTVVGGYGIMKANGKRILAHRLSYEIHVGPIQRGRKICHTCDTPLCCNPYHLFEGTQRDNIMDMLRKGRGRWQKR